MAWLRRNGDFAAVRDTAALARLIDGNGGVVAFSLAAGVGQGMLGHLKAGRRATCTWEKAAAVERAAGVRPGTLFSYHLDDGTEVKHPATAANGATA